MAKDKTSDEVRTVSGTYVPPAPPVVPPPAADPRDAEIERLRAELAAAKAAALAVAEKPPERTGPNRPARVCKEGDRAAEGFRRYKVRAVNRPDHAPTPTYLLADSEADARAEYLRHVKLDQDRDDKDPVRLFVKPLDD